MNANGTMTISIDSKVSGYARKRKERPTPFTGDMVWSIMTDRKTMTRRKPSFRVEVGDVLWVREAHRPYVNEHEENCIQFRVDNTVIPIDPYMALDGHHGAANVAFNFNARCEQYWNPETGKNSAPWRPPMFLPRWGCRLFLEVTAVREEPLQNITPEDAIKEGVWFDYDKSGYVVGADRKFFNYFTEEVDTFKMLWQSINGGGEYDWDKNPVIKVIEFKKLEGYK